DPNKVRVNVQVDESDISQVQVGQSAIVTFDALGQQKLDGKVSVIAPTGATTQGVVGYQVIIELDGAQGVRPGMTATAQIVKDEQDDVVRVPSGAAPRQGANRVVQVLAADGTTETHTVQVGLTNDTSTEIVSGLDAGDKVVLPSTTARASVPGAGAQTGFGGV